jgi:hypothetical protein
MAMNTMTPFDRFLPVVGRAAAAVVLVAIAPVRVDAADLKPSIRVQARAPMAGEIRVAAELAAGGDPAELFLDGEPVCTLTAEAAECSVDLGDDLLFHLP